MPTLIADDPTIRVATRFLSQHGSCRNMVRVAMQYCDSCSTPSDRLVTSSQAFNDAAATSTVPQPIRAKIPSVTNLLLHPRLNRKSWAASSAMSIRSSSAFTAVIPTKVPYSNSSSSGTRLFRLCIVSQTLGSMLSEAKWHDPSAINKLTPE